MMVSFVLSFFPRDVLDEILNLIESVSEDFPSYSSYALHNLFSIFNQIELLDSHKCKLFDTLVGSILNYGSEVWGMHEAKDVEITIRSSVDVF